MNIKNKLLLWPQYSKSQLIRVSFLRGNSANKVIRILAIISSDLIPTVYRDQFARVIASYICGAYYISWHSQLDVTRYMWPWTALSGRRFPLWANHVRHYYWAPSNSGSARWAMLQGRLRHISRTHVRGTRWHVRNDNVTHHLFTHLVYPLFPLV